jgi:hypothetical protein
MSSSDFTSTLAAQIALIAGSVAVVIGLISYSEPHSDDLFGRTKSALDDTFSSKKPHEESLLERVNSFVEAASPWTAAATTETSPSSPSLETSSSISSETDSVFGRAPESFNEDCDDDLKEWMMMT